MKIFIQGRKDGYKILYPRPTPQEFFYFARDIQSASAKSGSDYFGKSIYALALTNGGCIFSKYFIGYDFDRKDTGYIGVSIYIPDNKKLRGIDVKLFLDDLLQTYLFNYVDGHNITNRIEEWHLFSSLIDMFKSRLIEYEKEDGYKAGEHDAAYLFYDSDTLLQSIFDSPYQPEYVDFKEVFLVNEKFKQTGNPLDVFKNSGTEIKIDFSNEIFFLHLDNNLTGLKVSADGKYKTGRQGENKIRFKSIIELTYCADDRCFLPGSVTGSLSDTNSDIHKYLIRRGKYVSINFDSLSDLQAPREKTIRFLFKTHNQETVRGINFLISGVTKYIDSEFYDHVFRGSELIGVVKFKAVKDSKLASANDLSLSPFSSPQECNVILNHKVEFQIQAECDGNLIFDFNYSLNNGKAFPSSDNLIISNEELNQALTINVQKQDNNFEYVGSLEKFIPITINGGIIIIPCKKVPRIIPKNTRYPVSAGKHGKKSDKCPDYSTSKFGNDLKSSYIIANPGFKFSEWEHIDGTVTAQYEKKTLRNIKIAVLTVAGVFLIIILINDFNLNVIDKLLGRQTTGNSDSTSATDGSSETSGTSATDGSSVSSGTSGTSGTAASTGTSGTSAASATSGNSGSSASSGTSGTAASSGTAATSGTSTASGSSATSGTAATSGSSGASGTSGANGSSGTSATTNNNDLINSLKTKNLDKSELDIFLQTRGIDQNLKNSINLYIEFWSLDGKGVKTYEQYLIKINQDINLMDSKLKECVQKLKGKANLDVRDYKPDIKRRHLISYLNNGVLDD